MKLRGQLDTQPLNYSRKDLLKARASHIFRNHKKPLIVAGTILLLGMARIAMAPSCSTSDEKVLMAKRSENKTVELPQLRIIREVSEEQNKLNKQLIQEYLAKQVKKNGGKKWYKLETFLKLKL